MKKHIALIILQLAISGTDAYITHNKLASNRFHETNPIASPFVKNTSGQILFFSTETALKLSAAEIFRHQCKKLELPFRIWGIADNGIPVVYDSFQTKGYKVK